MTSPLSHVRLMGLPLPAQAALARRASWLEKARPSQLPPTDDWGIWLLLGGRGAGKTRTGAEDTAWFGLQNAGARIAVVAPTSADCRDTCVEGESGLLACIPPECVVQWNRSFGELTLWNETRFKCFSAEEPDRLRGPQHHRAWADEVAAWRYPDTWDQLQFGLRLGARPRVVATTTPRPVKLIRDILQDPDTRIGTESTFANSANLPPKQLERLQRKYGGTRLGRQELSAEMLEDIPGAIWTRDLIDKHRLPKDAERQGYRRIVVAIDPSGAAETEGEVVRKGSQQGIVVAGKTYAGDAHVLADLSCQMGPEGWARRAVDAYSRYEADKIVAERNYGGAMVEATIRAVDRRVPVKLVTATRGKAVRAEPVSALYEQGRVKHIGTFPELEDQMVAVTPEGYSGEGSPDRMDALVWAITELMLEDGPSGMLRSL